jgi:hypothetical protein
MKVSTPTNPRLRRILWWENPSSAGFPPRPRSWKLAALVLLTGYFLFCHGCHGDEDNELFARLRTWGRLGILPHGFISKQSLPIRGR